MGPRAVPQRRFPLVSSLWNLVPEHWRLSPHTAAFLWRVRAQTQSQSDPAARVGSSHGGSKQLSVIRSEMARSADDLALELSVLAGPDKMWDGIGYELALPEPRHNRLADFRVLLMDARPLCPTAVSVRTALEELTQHLVKLGCTVVRASPEDARSEKSSTNLHRVPCGAYSGTDHSP